MRQTRLSILVCLSLLFALKAAAQESVPKPESERFPKIRASLDDGFFVLAEQQARGVLRAEPKEKAEREAALLLTHALWGQKRYSEMLDLLSEYNGEPPFVYWRARAHFELKQYDQALKILEDGAAEMAESVYAPSALRLKAYMLKTTGEFEKAEAAYQQFAKDYPEHEDALFNQFDLAEILVLQKRIPEAIAAFEALVENKDPAVSQRAMLKLGHLLYTQGAEENFEQARAILTSLAVDENARLAYRIDAFVDLAALEEKAGKMKDAETALRKAALLSPDARQRVPLKLALARMLLRESNTAAALKTLEECRTEAPNAKVAAELQLEKAGALLQAGDFVSADAAYQVYLDVADDQAGLARAYLGKGLALWELGRFAESAAALDKAVKELKDPDERADALFKAGDAYYRADKFEDAEKRYRLFVTDFPKHKNAPNALYQLGLSLAPPVKMDAGLVSEEQMSEALATYSTIEKDFPADPFAEKASLQSAEILLASRRWQAALDKYTQISRIYTNSPAVAFSDHRRGRVLWDLGRYAESQRAFEKVMEEHPESEYLPQASYMRGFCLYVQGQVDEAVKTCKGFIDKYPDSEWRPEVMFWLAERYFNEGNYPESEPMFLRIAEEYKGHKLAPRALYWAGRAAAAQSNYVKAVERYSEVAKNYPESDVLPQTRFAQGDALSELGEFSRAILAFEEIIKKYPESHLVNGAWGRKGDCQFSLGVDEPARYTEAMHSYQAILDRPATDKSVDKTLRLQVEYKVGRCFEKMNTPESAFNRYMNVVQSYFYLDADEKNSPYSAMWFTRAAFGAGALKEKEKAWKEAVSVYEQVQKAEVPSAAEAVKRIEKIKKENWLLFQVAEEKANVGTDG